MDAHVMRGGAPAARGEDASQEQDRVEQDVDVDTFGPKVDGDLWRSRDSKDQSSTIAKVAIWRFFARRFVFGTKNLKTIQNIKWKPVIALNVYYVPVFFNPLRINGRALIFFPWLSPLRVINVIIIIFGAIQSLQ